MANFTLGEAQSCIWEKENYNADDAQWEFAVRDPQTCLTYYWTDAVLSSGADQTARNNARDTYLQTINRDGIDNGGIELNTEGVQTISSSSGTLTWEWSAEVKMAKTTLTENVSTFYLNGTQDGASGVLVVTQDATGGRTLALPAGSVVVNDGGGAIDLSAMAANEECILSFVQKGSTLYWTFGENYT